MARGNAVWAGAYQQGQGIGTVIGNQPVTEDQPAHEVLGPDTEAGQALLVAAAGFALLYFTVGRGATGIVGKVGAVLESVLVIAAAMWVASWTVRTYALRHPDGPLAQGLIFDM